MAVFAPAVGCERRRLLALGEAKWGDVMGGRHVERLRRARDLLSAKGLDTRDTVLCCFGGGGFATDLTEAREPDVRLIGLPELYA